MIELNNVHEIPGGAQFEKAVNDFNRKAISTMWNDFKKALAKASEPFHRKEMGERYFTMENCFQGAGVWVIATFVTCLPSILFGGSENVLMLHMTVGGAMTCAAFALGVTDMATMQRYRAEGKTYHSRSRGVRRWGNYNPVVLIFLTLFLLVTDTGAGIAFFVAYSMSAKVAGEQQAAIYSRYLDALDQKIENEYLENAILGECPVEITFLHKPLPKGIEPELRKNIAAAAVGKAVKIVAKPPQIKTEAQAAA